MNIKSKGVMALGGLLLAANIQAAPVFTLGVENNMGFHGVANKTGSGSNLAVGDILYGIINANNIYTTQTTTSWNDNNTSAPYDTLTGYFAAKVTAISTYTIPAGFGPLSGTYTSYTFTTLGASDVDPGNVFTAADKAAQTLVKFYTDTATPYESNGSVADDIAKATDGTFWASLGFAGGGYWTASTAPVGNGTTGGINFISNNTGLNWGKVLDTNCGVTGGCLVDMKFESSFSKTSGGAWAFSISDPATVAPVPVPGALWLLGSGLLGFGAVFRKSLG